jgi:3',5'-cyclic AMP phosphodiesterase CpdA
MARPPREPRVPTLALAALLALTGCRNTGPAASPSPTTPVATSTSRSVSPSPSRSPEPRPTVVGVLGDWGVDDAPVRQVVRLMTGFDGGRPLDAVVTTGDNAYARGTTAQAAFARRTLAPLLRRGTPLYAALGNHDEVTDGGRPVMRALGIRARWYAVTVGPVELVVLDANRPDDRAQLAFVRRVMAAPRRAAFRVVAFHQPVSSCSYHGPDAAVRRAWVPLFDGHVDLVLAGHNHTYERFTAPDGTPYVTTGGGGASLYPSVRAACRGYGRIAFLKTVHHAVRLTATATSLKVEAVGLDGKAFDSVTLRPR